MRPAPRSLRIRDWLLLSAAFFLVIGTLSWILWQPAPRTAERFDQWQNGLWIGHQWYTGTHVKTGVAVTLEERRALERLLDAQHIRDVFIHVGPIRPDGTIQDHAGSVFQDLRKESPRQRFIPWLGGDIRHLPLRDPAWRAKLVRTILSLQSEGFTGVHFDLEPVTDREPGYVELLRELRAAAGPQFFISQATRRAGPFGWSVGPMRAYFWSEGFYRDTMAVADQTVLMGYDTMLHTRKGYMWFVSHETRLLLKWAQAAPGHHVMIGIPSYEDMPGISDPSVENIADAAQGVRAALESRPPGSDHFEGVAVYAEWVTSPAEWDDYDRYWRSRN